MSNSQDKNKNSGTAKIRNVSTKELTNLPIREIIRNLFSRYVFHNNRPEKQELEFRNHVTTLFGNLINLSLITLLTIFLVTWPFDALFFTSVKLASTIFWWKVISILYFAWGILGLNTSEVLANNIREIFPLTTIAYTGFMGLMFGQIGFEHSDFLFFSSFIIPIAAALFPLFILERLLITFGLDVSFVVSYLTVHPSYYQHPYLTAQLQVIGALCLTSTIIGHAVFHLYRNYYFEVLSEREDREQVREVFSRFLTTSVMEDVLEDPEKLELGGQNQEITVLYTDINDFTNFSEGKPGKEVASILNDVLDVMTETILEFDGVVDKYLGDGLVSEFGILPMEPSAHSSRATEAALKMIHQLDELFQERRLLELDFRIGVHTGMAATGNMGTEKRLDFTAVGDTMNVGSRLENANKIYNTRCIISRSTYRKCSDKLVVRELDKVVFEGKKEPLTIYELLGNTRQDKKQYKYLISTFEEALRLYRNMNWDEALRNFEFVLDEYPNDGPSKVFIKRIETLRNQSPSTDWDGTYDLMGENY